MSKKCVLFLFLATAFTVLLAHNFTPHHHGTEHATHSHGHDHHGDDQEGSNENNSFHFIHHIGASGIEYTAGRVIKWDVQKKAYDTDFLKSTRMVFSHVEKPPIIGPLARANLLFTPETQRYFFQLKAPPAFTA